MNTPDKEPRETPKKHWSERCKDQMVEVRDFTKKFALRSSGVVGKLYYASLAVAGVAGLAGLQGIAGAGAVFMGAAGVAKITKMVWDHIRDLKDAAEDLEDGNENEISQRVDQTTAELEELRQIVAQQRDVIELQREASAKLQDSLIESNQRLGELMESHDNLADALKHFVGENGSYEVFCQAREAYREKYQREIDESVEKGEIEFVDFDPENDNLVRFEEEPNRNSVEEYALIDDDQDLRGPR